MTAPPGQTVQAFLHCLRPARRRRRHRLADPQVAVTVYPLGVPEPARTHCAKSWRTWCAGSPT